MTIHHAIYVSTANKLMNGSELTALLEASRRNNDAACLTGMLIYHGGNFIQALEGPGATVEQTLQRIQQDRRHHSIKQILRYDTEEREFPDWSMGFVSRPLEETIRQCEWIIADTKALHDRLSGTRPSRTLLRHFVDRAA